MRIQCDARKQDSERSGCKDSESVECCFTRFGRMGKILK
jgi:hypothetical protein